MKKTILALFAFALLAAPYAHAKMTHKWDEEHYSKGHFRVKKHDYPPAERPDKPQLDNKGAVDEHVKVDHKGRLYKASELPTPPVPPQPESRP